MKLFSPINIGKLEIKNRIVMSAVRTNLSKDGLINDTIINFYTARAKGGAGLITIGVTLTSKGANIPGVLTAHGDECVEGFKKLNQAMHNFGTKSALQLFHPGRLAHPFYNDKRIPISASAVPARLLPTIVPTVLSVDEIKALAEDFGQAARRGKESGFDFVEILTERSFLVGQFLSPASNLRADEYGGCLENRLRFAFEIVEAVKKYAGEDFPLIFRIASDENPDGYDLDEGILIAQALETNGAAALSVLRGGYEAKIWPFLMEVPESAYSSLFAEIKQNVKIPVIGGARLRDEEKAEEILVSGQADMIFWARPLIADPDLPNKIKEGQSKEIIPCISCDACMDEVFLNRPLVCAMNPLVGEMREAVKTEKVKKVAVVGAGPAGIKAALTASARGHIVTLYEAEDEIGGKLKLCSIPEGRAELGKALKYFKRQLEKSSVKIVLGARLDARKLLELQLDSVVIATGSAPVIPNIPEIEISQVITADKFLKEKNIPGKEAVIIGGGRVGCEVALMIARMGAMSAESAVFLLRHEIISAEQVKKFTSRGNRKVTIIEKKRNLGNGCGKFSRNLLLNELEMSGVEVLEAEAKEITGNQTVIIAKGYQSNRVGFEDFKHPEVSFIGDAVEPRGIREAIQEGFDVGKSL